MEAPGDGSSRGFYALGGGAAIAAAIAAAIPDIGGATLAPRERKRSGSGIGLSIHPFPSREVAA
jgi:hypothetical protein